MQIIMLLMFGCASHASSGPDPLPTKYLCEVVPKYLCKLKVSNDLDYTFGRRFFMCGNYTHDPEPPVRGKHQESPPPLCPFMMWVDEVQEPHWVMYVDHERQSMVDRFYARCMRMKRRRSARNAGLSW